MPTDQAKHEAERLCRLIEHWCPANFHNEDRASQLIRAFMHVTACCADQKRKLCNIVPIRPLGSYPDPMAGFKNTPTGF